MGLNLEYENGQTPLDEDEKAGLLIPTITTREELDEFEQLNIEEALQWVLGKTFNDQLLFSDKFVKELHKRMYGNVWKWAGEFRKTNKNLGVDKWQISTALKILNDDAIYWLNNQIYNPDEFAVRYKHRIVSIHCFANGNGRHSRLMADIIINKIFKNSLFTWGSEKLLKKGVARKKYLSALREADKGNLEPLILFARS